MAVARGIAVIALTGAAFFGFVFHERYWLWRHCFNDLGRCWDPVSEQVFVEGAGWIWGGFTAACLVIAGMALLLPRAWRSRDRRHPTSPG